MQQFEKKVDDLSEVEQLKKDISQSHREIETMRRAYEEVKAHFDVEHEALKVPAKKAKAEVFTQFERVQSLEADVLSLKNKSSSKGEVIKALEAKVEALVALVRKNDDLAEVSMRAIEAQEPANLDAERLMTLASVLDQIVGSSRSNLLAYTKLEASLGLLLFEGENVNGATFVQEVPSKMPHLTKALETLVKDVMNAESNRSTAFL